MHASMCFPLHSGSFRMAVLEMEMWNGGVVTGACPVFLCCLLVFLLHICHNCLYVAFNGSVLCRLQERKAK